MCVRACVLTRIKAGASSQPLVSLLERPEHCVEQHLVSGLSRCIQKLPGRHVVMSTCPEKTKTGLVNFRGRILEWSQTASTLKQTWIGVVLHAQKNEHLRFNECYVVFCLTFYELAFMDYWLFKFT